MQLSLTDPAYYRCLPNPAGRFGYGPHTYEPYAGPFASATAAHDAPGRKGAVILYPYGRGSIAVVSAWRGKWVNTVGGG